MALANYTIRIDPRHERIRDLEMIGMIKVLAKFAPKRIMKVIQCDLSPIYLRLYGTDDNPTPDQDWREGRVRPVPAGMVD